MLAVIICDRMKWTYEQWREAPTRMITAIVEMIHAENKEKKKRDGN